MFYIIMYEGNYKNIEYLRIIDGANIYTCTNKKNAVVMDRKKAGEVVDRISTLLEAMNIKKHVKCVEAHYGRCAK